MAAVRFRIPRADSGGPVSPTHFLEIFFFFIKAKFRNKQLALNE